jgi:hydroxymethylpyrimidine pyrophosphatase-like HAD family hydrolase
VTEGPMSIEITPKLGWTKNTAVRIMAQSMGASGKGVLYAGDGANDIDAFAAVASMGGIAVGVGLLPANLVDCCLPDTDALYDLIAEFEEELDSEIYN